MRAAPAFKAALEPAEPPQAGGGGGGGSPVGLLVGLLACLPAGWLLGGRGGGGGASCRTQLGIHSESVAHIFRSSSRSLPVLAAVSNAEVAGSNQRAARSVSVRQGRGFEPELVHACFWKPISLEQTVRMTHEGFTSPASSALWKALLGSEPRKFFAKTRVRTWCRYGFMFETHKFASSNLVPGVLRCRVDALVDVRDVAGGRLAEMRTAGVDLNTRHMRAGICRSGNEAHTRRKHEVFTEVNASGIPWPLAVADVP